MIDGVLIIFTHKVELTGASVSEPHTWIKNKNFKIAHTSVYVWDVYIPYTCISVYIQIFPCIATCNASRSYIAMLKPQERKVEKAYTQTVIRIIALHLKK